MWSPLQLTFLFGHKPSIVKRSDGRLDVFYADKSIYHSFKTTPNDPWVTNVIAEDNLGNALNGEPVVVRRNADSRLEVFWVHHYDFQIYNSWQTEPNGTFNPPMSLGGQSSPNRRPAVMENADGRLEVFVVSPDNQLYYTWQTSNNSGQWDKGDLLGTGPFVGDPVVARNADGRLELFMLGTDQRLYHIWQTSPNSSSQWFTSWAYFPRKEDTMRWPPSSTPAIASNADGRLEVFMLDEIGYLYHIWQTSPSRSSQWGDRSLGFRWAQEQLSGQV